MKVLTPRFNPLLLSALILPTVVHRPPVLAQANHCVNYWINSRTGQPECLDADVNANPPIPSPPPSSAKPQPSPSPPTGVPAKPISGQPATAPGTAETWLNRLQVCQPSEISMPHPLAALIAPDLMARMVIKGWQDNRCLVEYHAQSTLQRAVEQMYVQCYFPQQSLDLLTDEKAYDEARSYDRTGQITATFHPDENPRDRAVSDAMSSACQVPGFPQSWRSQS